MADKYTIVLRGEVKAQKFTDAREAAVAYYNADAAKAPTVIREDEKGGARFLATTAEQRSPDGVNKFQKSVPDAAIDKAFRETYDQLTRERGDRGRAEVSDKSRVEQLQIRDPKDGGQIEAAKARAGESYQGRVVAITDKHVVQHAVDKDGRDLGHVAHERKAVSGLKEDQAVGQLHRISYPHGEAGIARQINQLETKQAHSSGPVKADAGKDRSA